MRIILTASELSDMDAWADYCEDHGIDPQTFAECGNWNDEFVLTGQEFIKYGLSLAAHE
jgi:hypothetical protein